MKIRVDRYPDTSISFYAITATPMDMEVMRKGLRLVIGSENVTQTERLWAEQMLVKMKGAIHG